MEFEIRPPVRLQILEAAAWYQARLQGLGADFVDEVDKTLSQIERSPFLFPAIDRDARRVIMSHFPHAIYFVVRSERISVFALAHLSRNPKVWKKLIPSARRSRH